MSVFKSSDVRILGLPAGSVSAVEVEGNRVRVDLKIPNDIPVPEDVTAKIVPQSLIGERYVQLAPAFEDGMERAPNGLVIDEDHVIVPVEPDEALAALKEFLDSLDPKGLGRLVTNLEEDLRGNGSALNRMLDSFSDVVTTFAEKDEAVGRIVDSFDRLTTTLATREQQLGQVLDAFAEASQVLADERGSIEGLVAGLADLSREGLALVGEHDQELRTDIQTLTDAAAVIDANLSSVSQLLDAGGLLGTGLRRRVQRRLALREPPEQLLAAHPGADRAPAGPAGRPVAVPPGAGDLRCGPGRGRRGRAGPDHGGHADRLAPRAPRRTHRPAVAPGRGGPPRTGRRLAARRGRHAPGGRVVRRLTRVVATGLALAAVAAGCSLPGQVEGPVQLTAVFADVGDLVSGHSVQVADVRVGSITRIELTDDYQARVTMKIKDDLHLPKASEAILRTTSLLGEKFVELRAPKDDAGKGDELVDGDVVAHTRQAPELEFVAEEAVQVLAGVAANDLGALVETGGIGFGGRAVELGRLIDSLAVVSGSLADGTEDIVAIVDGLDQATATLAAGDDRVDELLVNLSRTTDVLATNRDLTLQTLRDLTRLAAAENDLVFEPYRADVERQVQQLDAILALVAERRAEVGVLVDWLARFAPHLPKGVPGDFALIYAWFEIAALEDGQ